MDRDQPLFFALRQSADAGDRIAGQFGFPLSLHEEREFAGGEHKIRPLEEVSGRRVYVVHSLYGDAVHTANDKLCRLLFFIGALRDAGAASITAMVPYLAYARKDRRTKPYDPVTTRYVASLFEAVGVDGVITLGVHNPAAMENAFHCVYRDLDAAPLFADYFARRIGGGAATILAPDTGAVKHAQRLQLALAERGLSAGLAFMTKTRSQDIVTSSPLFGDVRDRSVIIYDDLISSGTTIANAVRHCQHQAGEVFVAATHGAFTAEAKQLLAFDLVRELVISDSVVSTGIDRYQWGERLQVLDSSGLFADAVRRRGL